MLLLIMQRNIGAGFHRQWCFTQAAQNAAGRMRLPKMLDGSTTIAERHTASLQRAMDDWRKTPRFLLGRTDGVQQKCIRTGALGVATVFGWRRKCFGRTALFMKCIKLNREVKEYCPNKPNKKKILWFWKKKMKRPFSRYLPCPSVHCDQPVGLTLQPWPSAYAFATANDCRTSWRRLAGRISGNRLASANAHPDNGQWPLCGS